MVGLVVGDYTWELSAAGEETGIDLGTDRLCKIFDNDTRKHVGRSMMTKWGAERYVRGAYAAARSDRSEVRGVLNAACSRAIFFADEHLAGPLIQTCRGARLSGEADGCTICGATPAHLKLLQFVSGLSRVW